MAPGCAYNSHSVSLLKRHQGFANHDPPTQPNKKNSQGRRKQETETPKKKGKKDGKQRKQKIRKWEIKKEKKDHANGKGKDKKRRLGKLEKMKARERMRIGNE